MKQFKTIAEMKDFDLRKYLTEGWMNKESNENHILFDDIKNLVEELADEEGIVDLRPANLDLTWIDEDDEDAEEIGAYILSLGEDGEIYVSTGSKDGPMVGDDVTLKQYCSLLQDSGASAHDVDIMLDSIVEALRILKEGE